MTQLLRKDQMDKREDLHKFHQLWILPLPPLRSQALGKLGFTFVTTRLVNIGTLQMSKRRNLLEDAAATRQTSGKTDVFVSMFVCSSDTRS